MNKIRRGCGLPDAGLRLAVLLCWAAILPRLVPDRLSDRGIFVSVAERLRAGDRLYADVWDNKDPLFSYALAVGRTLSPRVDVALEVLYLALALIAVHSLCRAVGLGARARLGAVGVLAPCVLTGGVYLAGQTYLPGVALALVAYAAARRQHFPAAGVALGLLVFTKILVVPVAAVLVGRRVWRCRSRRTVFGVAAGTASGLAVVSAALIARGEAVPYAESLLANIAYARAGGGPSTLPPVLDHLAPLVATETIGLILAVFGGVALTSPGLSRRFGARLPDRGAGDDGSDADPVDDLWIDTALAALASVLVLAITGVWAQHVQLLQVCGVLVAVLVAAAAERARPQQGGAAATRRRLLVAAAVVAFVAAAWLHGPRWVLTAYAQAPRQWAGLTDTATETRLILAQGSHGSYARVGWNDDGGHAQGLSSWRLACPRFHQYPFEDERILRATLSCLDTADVVLFSPSTAPGALPVQVPDWQRPRWEEFVAAARAEVARHHRCSVTNEAYLVCVRIEPTPTS